MVLSDPTRPTSRLTALFASSRPRPPAPAWAHSARDVDASTIPIPVTTRAFPVDLVEPVGRVGATAGSPPTEEAEPARMRRRGLLDRCWPASWRRVRVDPGRSGATALVLVMIVAAVLAAVGVWLERPQVIPVGEFGSTPPRVEPAVGPGLISGPADDLVADRAAAPISADTATAPTAPSAPLVVSVSGKVHRPGLVEVPPGARVADALAAAGGALPGTDLSQLNLARRVSDGEQVAVGVQPAPDAAVPGPPEAGQPSAGSGAPPGRLDLNAATVEQLDGLPGVGPVTAQRILDWRNRNGRFARVEQLREIEGIGERRFGQLRELVSV